MTTPFGYIAGPFYTYEIRHWIEPDRTEQQVIYVGRGRGRRARVYYRFVDRAGNNRYHNPKGHNPGLDAAIAAVRAAGCEIMVIAQDHGSDLVACKAHEKKLVRKYGRIGVHSGGTLHNRNAGG